jgi:hypothetical protein
VPRLEKLIEESKALLGEEAIAAAPIQVHHHQVLVHPVATAVQALILAQRGDMIDLVISETRRRKFAFPLHIKQFSVTSFPYKHIILSLNEYIDNKNN